MADALTSTAVCESALHAHGTQPQSFSHRTGPVKSGTSDSRFTFPNRCRNELRQKIALANEYRISLPGKPALFRSQAPQSCSGSSLSASPPTFSSQHGIQLHLGQNTCPNGPSLSFFPPTVEAAAVNHCGVSNTMPPAPLFFPSSCFSLHFIPALSFISADICNPLRCLLIARNFG